jgi:putative transposase
VLLRLPYLALTGVFTTMRLLPVSDIDKDIEILALHHQLAILQRQTGKPRLTPADRAFPRPSVPAAPVQAGAAAPDRLSRYGAALAMRREAPRRIPDSVGRNLEGRSWV